MLRRITIIKKCLRTNGITDNKTYLMLVKTFGMLLMFITIHERTDVNGVNDINDDFKHILVDCFKPHLMILKGNNIYSEDFIKSITYYFVFRDKDIRPLFQTYSRLLNKNKNLNVITKLDIFYNKIQDIINYEY